MARIPPEVSRAREAQAWNRRTQGWTQAQIADELGVDQTAGSHMLRRVRDRVLQRLDAEIEAEIADQIGQLHYVISQSMRAWHRSTEPRVTTRRPAAEAERAAAAAEAGDAEAADADAAADVG